MQRPNVSNSGDQGHQLTEDLLAALETRITAVYGNAAREVSQTVADYFAQFAKRDQAQQQRLQKGEITQPYYTQWRLAQIGRGKRFQALADRLADRMTNANQVAAAYINDATPGIYSLNRNYAAYTIEQQVGRDVGFDLWDEQTVKRLIVQEPDLMPWYPPKRAINRGIDLVYGKRQITNQVRSGILMGESIPKLTQRIQQNIPTMNRASAIRAARTAVTAAQNGGRQASYQSAEQMGIKLQKQWLATLDARTRPTHGAADGQTVAQDKPFSVGGAELMYPGDPKGPPAEVYNCRCATIALVEGVHMPPRQTYSEWLEGKSAGNQHSDKPGIPVQIGEVDFSDKKAVLEQIEAGEKATEFLDYEVNYSITTDGKVWKVAGEGASVNPRSIPSSLVGSYSYHNHPAKDTWYSFSAEDAAFFIDSREAYSKASDHLYQYVMKRTEKTVALSYEEVYNRFNKIFSTNTREKAWNGEIDMDIDGFHETMKVLSRELGFEYERKKKKEIE